MITASELEQLENNFTYHPPDEISAVKYTEIRDRAKLFARFLLETCPPTRERSLAITAIENSVFWANASIARFKPITTKETRLMGT